MAIYRFKCSLDLMYRFDGVSIFPDLPTGVRFGDECEYWEDSFERLAASNMANNLRIFKAPLFPHWKIAVDVKFPTIVTATELPEFLPIASGFYVSERVKNIIESFDDLGHQFCPVKFFNKNDSEMPEDTFFRLQVRRFVEFQCLTVPMQEINFIATDLEKKIIPAIQHSNDLRMALEGLPLWSYEESDRVIYVNEELMQRFDGAAIRGISELAEMDRINEEDFDYV